MIATENPGFPNTALIASNGSVKYKYNVIYIYNVIMLNINKCHLICISLHLHIRKERSCVIMNYTTPHTLGGSICL